MKKFNFKSWYPYLIALGLFIVIAFAYFPELFQGKIVNQSDISHWRGAANEIIEYREQTGEEPLWTNSMFSGMPTTMISTLYKGNYLEPVYKFLFVGPRPASFLLLAFVSFFLLLLAFGVNVWFSIVGALAYGFCAYNFQIIDAGHNSKMIAIALMPMVFAAVVYAFRKRAWLGAIFFGVALSFQIFANHVQITYYLAMVVIAYGIAQLYLAVKEKTIPAFLKTSGLLVVAGLLAVAVNTNHLWPAWEYSKQTMRGGSELTFNSNTQNKGGLDKEYATNWSYGVGESMNLLIPNFVGGSSAGALGTDSETYRLLKSNGYPNAEQVIKQMPLYWGPQAFTGGPMYMGAISIFLFVLGLILIKGPMKWWVAGISLLALMLGWGRHFMPLTNFFFDYMPLYNKFRVPSMILVILQLTIPLFGFYTLHRIFKDNLPRPEVIKGLKIAVGITAGICALFALIPGLAGDFSAPQDQQMVGLSGALQADRKSLLRSDAFRSMIFILLAAATLYFGLNKKLTMQRMVIVLGVLIVIDMWTIDKRYLNNDDFVTQRQFDTQYQLRPVDRAILQDQDPDYRVLDLTRDIFNDSYTSYFHKSIGGYSAAKLQRYQDLIEYFLAPEIRSLASNIQNAQTLTAAEESLSRSKVINMLNTRYIVIDPNGSPLENRSAYGNAWFVKEYRMAADADKELLGLKEIDPRESAVINQNFNSILQDRGFNYDENATIQLTSYAPNHLEYRSSASDEQLALFSEVYYPEGWQVTIDGQAADLFRANYILRALIVPAGEHTIVFSYHPASYYTGARISAISSGLLILLLLGSIGYFIFRKKEPEDDPVVVS